ncbi:hypothetical protein SAMN05444320_1051 [Streptoalloteichus hindustanus]|uniref:Uncharacterized protein n=1 Tax=Streptoalloteichus hindustanus TaxID=2017 RepID=A0A1M5EI79_STRHI|nr:hypothetical protein SAMN05444320_1051 [Streptoalloteichus hindustanus]
MGQAREALAAVAAGKPLPAGLGEAVAVVPPWQSGAPTQAVVTKAVPSLASPAEPRPATARPTPPPTSVSPLPATGAEERPESRPWYRRAGLLYGTSVVLAVATGIVVTNLIMAHNRQTGDASAFPTSSDARHTASAPGGPPEQSADGRPQAPPRISSTGPSSTPTSSSPSPTPTTTPKHDGDGQEDRVEAVSDYYELLPGNTDAAWSRLTPNARNKTQGLASYRSWWAGVKSIDVAEHAAAGGGVRAKLVYHMRDGRVVEDDMTFTLVQQGESYLIDDWQLLGSRKVG